MDDYLSRALSGFGSDSINTGLGLGDYSFNTGGLLGGLSSIGSTLGSGLNALGDYKDAIKVGAGLFNAYSDYQSASAMQDYYKAIMAEQARQVAKEEQATTDMQSGFSSSALYNPNEKTSNYYSV